MPRSRPMSSGHFAKRIKQFFDILLAKVQLCQEFILGEYVRGGEDGLVSQVDTHPAPADLGMVVFEPNTQV